MSPAVEWDWWLCQASDLSQIGQLNAHQRQVQEQLNSGGKVSCWVHLLDDIAEEVIVHQTALRLDRNGETVWSGEIMQANETASADENQLQITAMGWAQALNQRLIHTGVEFQQMLLAPSGLLWQRENGVYLPLGIDTAVQLAYDYIENPSTSDAAIIFDLLDRANIDSSTLISRGEIHGAPIGRNLTLQRLQNLGQQITQLTNVESGCDVVVDPVTRKLDLYGPGASNSPLIANGRGFERAELVFSYPGNCISATRNQDGMQTANRVEVLGQYGAGRADDLQSQAQNRLREVNDSLSEVVDPNILIAYAQAEVAVRSQPWTVISFVPRSVIAADAQTSGVPRPYEDFHLGDVVSALVDYGRRFQVDQGVRVFGFTLAIDDFGVERLQSVQTTYQGLGS